MTGFMLVRAEGIGHRAGMNNVRMVHWSVKEGGVMCDGTNDCRNRGWRM